MSPEPPPGAWRPMRPDDLGAVERLGNAIHVDHPESPDVFAERQRLCPEGCFVLPGPEGLSGYVISHPWRLGNPPKLDTMLGALPAHPDTCYIHDLALHPSARGTGAAPAIVTHLATSATARHLPTMSLIAVGHSPAFWTRQGFKPAPLPGGKLDSYGPGAAHMVRSL
jgi:ribosomal protein S18 acetylase RimI-like enzyme